MKQLRAIKRSRYLWQIFISVCVVCLTAKTSLILYGNNGNIHVLLFTFFSTLFLYGFHSAYSQILSNAADKRIGLHVETAAIKNEWYWALICVALICAFVQLLFLPLRTWIVIVPVMLISAGYSIPLVRMEHRFVRLRDILWLKPIWISLAYALLTTCLPIAYDRPLGDLLQSSVLFIFFRNFLFVFALTIPFDIRDIKADIRSGIRTLPARLGIKGSIRASLILMLVFMFSTVIELFTIHMPVSVFLALVISAIQVAMVVPLSSPNKSKLFFPLAIEGSMILQWGVLYVFHVLSV